MAYFENSKTTEKNSDRVLAKLDKEYEFDEYQEMVREQLHEVDIIPYLVLISTDENEYDMHLFNTANEVKDYIKETVQEQSGWSISHIFHNGKEIEFTLIVNLEE